MKLPALTLSAPVILGAVAVGAALVWAKSQGGVAVAAQNLGTTIGTGAVHMVDGVLSGTVNTIGQAVGIPQTNMSECERAKAEGRTWDASFACPAGDFLRYWWG